MEKIAEFIVASTKMRRGGWLLNQCIGPMAFDAAMALLGLTIEIAVGAMLQTRFAR